MSLTCRRKRGRQAAWRLVAIAVISVASSVFVARAEKSGSDGRSDGQADAPADWKEVQKALGKTGSLLPGDVFKVGIPRTDLNVSVQGVRIKPAFALGGWVAFKDHGDGAMVMGDLVLTQNEIGPVMMKLQENGIEQTAVHNHLLNESPRVMYMHISGRGDAVALAKSIRAALALTKTPFGPPAPSRSAKTIAMNTKEIDRILGRNGKINGGVYQFGIPRAQKVTVDGMEVPPSMGTATSINFQPTGGRKAAITGDFVLVASEVNPVIKTLRENGILVTALHSHMLTEDPRLFFMHFWANDDSAKLARGLRAALDKMDLAK